MFSQMLTQEPATEAAIYRGPSEGYAILAVTPSWRSARRGQFGTARWFWQNRCLKASVRPAISPRPSKGNAISTVSAPTQIGLLESQDCPSYVPLFGTTSDGQSTYRFDTRRNISKPFRGFEIRPVRILEDTKGRNLSSIKVIPAYHTRSGLFDKLSYPIEQLFLAGSLNTINESFTLQYAFLCNGDGSRRFLRAKR